VYLLEHDKTPATLLGIRYIFLEHLKERDTESNQNQWLGNAAITSKSNCPGFIKNYLSKCNFG
jgi:hypothetical protein